MYKVNPLNVSRQRIVDRRIRHFAEIELSNEYIKKAAAIHDWILANLRSRFYVQSNFAFVDSTLYVGFEDPTELTLFSLHVTDFL